MTKDEYWYWICNIKNIYQKDIRKLLDTFHEPEEVFRAHEDDLTKSGAVDEIKAHAVTQSKNHFRGLYRLEKLRYEGIEFIYWGSEKYPVQLLNLEDRPFALYVKGSLPDADLPAAGIVGARNCSGYGKEMTLRFSQTLAANSVQIISGMALGIDSVASAGAIEAGGKTFAVLGSGLDVIYPPQNIELYYQIIMNGGGIISEYPMGTAPIGWQFPFRNRLISAFSDVLLIMEARKRSGTLSTAAHALSQGKDIYALPGRITDPLSEGCNSLIADGAGILTDPKYILDLFYQNEQEHRPSVIMQNHAVFLKDENKRRLYDIMSYEPKTIDEITAESGMSSARVCEVLTEMEMDGLCSELSKDCYVKESYLFP